MKIIDKKIKALFVGGLFFLSASLLCFPFVPSALAVTLVPGDIIVADFNGGGGGPITNPPGGRVYKLEANGTQTMISSGGLLDVPLDVKIDAAGNIIVLDAPTTGTGGQIIKIDPDSGSQTVISENGLFDTLREMEIAANGNIIVADHMAGLITVDPITGLQTPFTTSGGYTNYISDVDIDGAGNLYVTSSSGTGLRVVKIDPDTGVETLISEGTFNTWQSGILVDDDAANIYVAELYWANGIIRVDPVTGAQSFISSGWPFQDPYNMDFDLDGNIVVADTNWFWNGNIIEMDPDTPGSKAVINSGGLVVDPAGIAVYPEPSVNQAPIAEAGSDQAVINEVILYGGDSYDPDGTIESYEWELLHRVDSAYDRIANGENPTVSELEPGFYDVTLTVVDDGGEVGTDTMLLAVADSGYIDELEALLIQKDLEIVALKAELATAEADIAALEAEKAALEAELATAEDNIAALEADKATLEAELATAEANIAALEAEKAALEAELATAEAKLLAAEQEIANLTQSLQSAFADPQFSIPGDSTEEQINNLVNAIGNLNHGQQQALYENLGGTKGKGKKK